MGRNRYKKLILPIFLFVIAISVTSCFVFFMHWTDEGLIGTWKYTNSSINEKVILKITKDTIELVFDEDNPSPYYTYRYFNDWGIRGSLFVDEDALSMSISISELYRYYSKWYYFASYPYYEWRSITGGDFWRTVSNWPSYWSNTPVQYPNFFNYYPGNNLGADYATRELFCTYLLSGDRLTLTFPGGSAGSYDFNRQ